jgi:hypothetical protein
MNPDSWAGHTLVCHFEAVGREIPMDSRKKTQLLAQNGVILATTSDFLPEMLSQKV